MLRWIPVVRTAVAATLLLCPAVAAAQTSASYGPTSLARIRAALAEPPPRLQAPPPSTDVVPMFRVEVYQPFSMRDPFEEPPPDPTWGLPSAGELLMGGIGKIGSAVSGVKKRRVKKQVRDALAEFCAVHACPAPATPQTHR